METEPKEDLDIEALVKDIIAKIPEYRLYGRQSKSTIPDIFVAPSIYGLALIQKDPILEDILSW